MSNNKPYEPGITELRINVKGFISMAEKMSKDMTVMTERMGLLENQNATLTEENIAIREQLQTIQAKLYEKGIR
jgi:chaperonin cofactor prefoldin